MNRQLYIAATAILAALPPTIHSVRGAEFYDNFSAGLGAWQVGAAWSFQSNATTGPVMSVNTLSDEFAWNTRVTLGRSWGIETEFSFVSLYNDNNWTGTAGISLGNQTTLLILADVIYSQDAYAYPGMGYWNGQWNNSMNNPVWHPQATRRLRVRLERPPGRDFLRFTVTGTNGFRREFTSRPIPASTLDQVSRVGLRGFKSRINFHVVSVTTPLPPTLAIALIPPILNTDIRPGLTIRGEPGKTHSVQYSDLAQPNRWTTLTNLTLNQSTVQWIDPTATMPERRFYRVEQR